MSETTPTIIYTETDEAPALATYSLLPILRAFLKTSGVRITPRDISLAARILAVFEDRLPESQRVPNTLAELGELAKRPEANIIKLPNISASVPQLKAAIKELQDQGYDLPDYPDEPNSDEQREVKSRYDRVKGSAVNPVLREGNSDRRAPKAVKEYARKNPHRMGKWSKDSKTRVATMGQSDFRSNEKSVTVSQETTARIEHVSKDGSVQVLKDGIPLKEGEIIDATFLSRKALLAFLERQIQEARQEGILLSLHLKATMMKVSDPIIFGHAVRAFFKPLFEKHGSLLEEIGAEPRDGLAQVLAKLAELPLDQRQAVETSVHEAYENGPDLAMVDSDRGITNLHVPSDVIIDASMPAMIRSAGQMWNKNNEQQDTLAVIPDSSYACVYDEVIRFCKEHGAFDPTTMGSVPNVGLMAQMAEEYGSHDKTFEMAAAGLVRVRDAQGQVLTEHEVEAGDIWRMCQTKDAAIRDWVKLAVTRARNTGDPAIFWLDSTRSHDEELIRKVDLYLKDHETSDLDLRILAPTEATRLSCQRLKEGKNTISVTGNVLRDYLTDLFPILEVGTSAKMLSIVPLMNGGGLFETGAGGSAPKHVQQFQKENYLRWDSLGEFLALGASLEHVASSYGMPRISLMAEALDQATMRFLENNKSPTRKLGGIDNRGSHFYLGLYWAQALAEQSKDQQLASTFQKVAEELSQNEEKIVGELNGVQGTSVDVGGYYFPNKSRCTQAMRPSATLNRIIDNI